MSDNEADADVERGQQDEQLLPGEPVTARQRRWGRGLAGWIALALLLLAWFAWKTVQEETGAHGVLVTVAHGAVAADSGTCSQIGVDVLRKGGNAMDAAIAALLCVGSVNLQSSGLGGGGFMVVRAPNGTASAFNFREMAPARADTHMFDHDPLAARVGGLAVAVPGEVHGLWTAHQLYGRLPWADLFAPAIALNEEGFAISPRLAQAMQSAEARFTTDPSWSFMLGADGRMLRQGDRLVRKAYAASQRLVAEQGPHVFYNGSIAASLVEHANSCGGVLSTTDFANYRTVHTAPLNGSFDGLQVLTCPKPCSGPVLMEGLNIIEGFELREDALSAHRMVEAMKWLSAGRTELGDVDPLLNNAARVEEITGKEWAAEVRLNISDTHTFDWRHYRPVYQSTEPAGTTHLSALDVDGMAVAVTSTVNLYFGAQVHDPQTGIVLNSQMDDFSIPNVSNAYELRHSVYNLIHPRKRPLSSTAPTIVVRNGLPELVIGAAGGSLIVTTVFEAIVRLLRYHTDLKSAVEMPRMHHQLIPQQVLLEAHFDEKIARQLAGFGHNVTYFSGGSVMQAIHRVDDTIYAISDPRKGGVAAGY